MNLDIGSGGSVLSERYIEEQNRPSRELMMLCDRQEYLAESLLLGCDGDAFTILDPRYYEVDIFVRYEPT